MRVFYDKTTYPTVHRKLGVKLVPGEFDCPDEKAEKLIELGLVTAVSPPAPTTVDESEPETTDTVSEVEEREDLETESESEEEQA